MRCSHSTTAVTARNARRITNAQVHLATGEMHVLGDLRAGLSAADHQHGAFGQ
jgi:hypothetical protein